MSKAVSRFDDATSKILCRSFGFGRKGFSTFSNEKFELSDNAMLWNILIQCNGSENNVSECELGTTDRNQWITELDYWTRLHCFDYEVTDIRLRGGVYPHGGRLEVKAANRWGYVGGNHRGNFHDGDIMCSFLGYIRESVHLLKMSDSVDWQAVTEVWMTSLSCESGVTDINNCTFEKGVSPALTYTIEFACEPLQLVNGSTPNTGIIETGLFGKLQMICGTSDFNHGAANVTCNLLGHQR